MSNLAIRSLIAAVLVCSGAAVAQLTPPTILKGSSSLKHVHCMTNNQNSLATLGNGEVAAVIYQETTSTSGGHLTLAWSNDGLIWNTYFPLPNNTGHRVHEWNSGVLCASRDCDVLHVGWADRSFGGTYHSAYYQAFNVKTRKWIGTPTRIATADANNKRGVFTRDIAVTWRGTLAIAIGVGANGGQSMGAWDCGLLVKKDGAAGFSKLYPMRNGGLAWSREASIAVVEEVVHCAFKNLKGAGGMAYRSFDLATLAWQQTTQVMVGPNNNGTIGIDGINAGNKGMITADTLGGLYIMYVTGSKGGRSNNNKMRMAYAAAGTGSKNSDWSDLEILKHTTTLGNNPRGVKNPDPAYPKLQGGDTDYHYYTITPGISNAVFILYSKPWEDFQNKYMQIWLQGVNQPFPGKEIQYWSDSQPYVFERLGAMRNTGSLGHGVWVVSGKNDKPVPGQAPNGWVRLWVVTPTTARTISYGTGCPGLSGKAPRMRADPVNLPQIGLNYQINIDRMPPLALFRLIVGFTCQDLNLSFMGAGACTVHTDYPAVYAFQADSSGKFVIPWSIPNDLSLVGLHFITQTVVFDWGAPANVTVSNALRTMISN